MIELLEFKHLIFEHISYGSKLDNIILLSSKLLNSKICYSNIKHNNIHSIDFKEIDSLIKLLVMDDFLLSNEIYNKFNNNIKKINYVNYNDIYIFPIFCRILHRDSKQWNDLLPQNIYYFDEC